MVETRSVAERVKSAQVDDDGNRVLYHDPTVEPLADDGAPPPVKKRRRECEQAPKKSRRRKRGDILQLNLDVLYIVRGFPFAFILDSLFKV